MAMPTPPEELEPASDDELLTPCRPRFAGSGMRGLPSLRARLGGGTSVSNSANGIKIYSRLITPHLIFINSGRTTAATWNLSVLHGNQS